MNKHIKQLIGTVGIASVIASGIGIESWGIARAVDYFTREEIKLAAEANYKKYSCQITEYPTSRRTEIIAEDGKQKATLKNIKPNNPLCNINLETKNMNLEEATNATYACFQEYQKYKKQREIK